MPGKRKKDLVSGSPYTISLLVLRRHTHGGRYTHALTQKLALMHLRTQMYTQMYTQTYTCAHTRASPSSHTEPTTPLTIFPSLPTSYPHTSRPQCSPHTLPSHLHSLIPHTLFPHLTPSFLHLTLSPSSPYPSHPLPLTPHTSETKAIIDTTTFALIRRTVSQAPGARANPSTQ